MTGHDISHTTERVEDNNNNMVVDVIEGRQHLLQISFFFLVVCPVRRAQWGACPLQELQLLSHSLRPELRIIHRREELFIGDTKRYKLGRRATGIRRRGWY
jgi:hypothetical protein